MLGTPSTKATEGVHIPDTLRPDRRGVGADDTLRAADGERSLNQHRHASAGPALVALEGEDSIEPVPDRSAAPAQAPAPR